MNYLVPFLLFKNLIVIVNPLLVALIYLHLRPKIKEEQKRIEVFQIFLVSSLLGLMVSFFGKGILHFLGLSIDYIKMAGGLMIISSAWGMLGRKDKYEDSRSAALSKSIINPMVIPICMGGGTISIILTTTASLPFQVGVMFSTSTAIILTYGLTALCCYFGEYLKKFVGDNIVEIFTILCAFIMLAIGLTMVVEPMKALWLAPI